MLFEVVVSSSTRRTRIIDNYPKQQIKATEDTIMPIIDIFKLG